MWIEFNKFGMVILSRKPKQLWSPSFVLSLCIEVDNLASHILDYSQANLSPIYSESMPWSALSGTYYQYRSGVVQVEITVKIFFKFLWSESIQIQARVQLGGSLTPMLLSFMAVAGIFLLEFCPLCPVSLGLFPLNLSCKHIINWQFARVSLVFALHWSPHWPHS